MKRNTADGLFTKPTTVARQGGHYQSLYQKIKGLGGFRNILVHDYLKVDLTELQRNLLKAFEVFPAFSSEIQHWLKTIT